MLGFRNLMATAGLAVLAAFLAPGVWADDGPKAKGLPADADKLASDASDAEKAGKYEKALGLYLKAFTAGRADPATRDRIRGCLRHVSQADRHRNPNFQKFVLALPPSDALTLYAEVLDTVNKTYADRTRATVERLFLAGLDELDAALGEPAFRKEHLSGVTDDKLAEFRTTIADTREARLPANPLEAVKAAREVVAVAYKTLGLKNGTAVVFELLCGACAGLDEYSAYHPPGTTPAAPPLAELAAYGLTLRADALGVTVADVAPHSWAAAHTKLRKGDRIQKVNGKDVAGATPAALADAMRAADTLGHRLELTPFEDDPASEVRLPTPLPTVYAVELLDAKAGVGYLRLAALKDRTPQEFDDAVLELKARGMKALVIDLRGNPGGLFAAAVGVAKRLIPVGPLATTDGQVPDFASRVFASDSGMSAHDFPVVLLVDTKTMSAAEILAASLKDNQRATLVGLPTFGKGLVQATIRLHALDPPGDERAAKSGVLLLSVGSAGGPLSGLIHGRGVTPHVTEGDPDRQLELAVEKAVELVTGMRSASMPPLVMR